MVINILEDITVDLASKVVDKLTSKTVSEVDVNIMSRGGDMMAGNAIIAALKMSPAKVTTKVYGVAASMAAAISQAGDRRLIASDAIFQPHNGAGFLGGRPTKENLAKSAEALHIMDEIMLQSFSKSNLTKEALKDLLIEDKPIAAQEAIDMAFFDGSMEPIEANAYLNTLKMEVDNSLMAKLSALKAHFMPKAGEEGETKNTPANTATPAEGVEGEAVSRAEFDKLVALVEDLIAKMSPLEPPSVTEQVAAEVDTILKAMKSTAQMPAASTANLETDEKAHKKSEGVNYLETRQREIQSKFNK